MHSLPTFRTIRIPTVSRPARSELTLPLTIMTIAQHEPVPRYPAISAVCQKPTTAGPARRSSNNVD